MTELRALPGIRYDPGRVGDLGQVVSPPYDVIPEEDLESYRARSPYNVIRLIRPGGDYAGARAQLDAWLAEGVLREDEPSMYMHEVSLDGGRTRLDLLAALRLRPYADRTVLPHEQTHRGPKEDRLALMRATGMSLEPLWFLYDGEGTDLLELLAGALAGAPLVSFTESSGERHRLWRVADPDWHRSVAAEFAALPVLIADGHHRYETTLAYSQEVEGRPDAASRFTLAMLTDLGDPGLAVLPTHRLLKAGVAVSGGEPAGSLDEVLAAIQGRVAAGTYRDGKFQIIPLEGEVTVLELHRQVIDNILGKRNPEEYLTYTRDAAEAVRWVDEERGVAAFFLDTPDLRAVLRLAREGKTMPQKTTYFFPKPPSGMVFHRLDPNRSL